MTCVFLFYQVTFLFILHELEDLELALAFKCKEYAVTHNGLFPIDTRFCHSRGNASMGKAWWILAKSSVYKLTSKPASSLRHCVPIVWSSHGLWEGQRRLPFRLIPRQRRVPEAQVRKLLVLPQF